MKKSISIIAFVLLNVFILGTTGCNKISSVKTGEWNGFTDISIPWNDFEETLYTMYASGKEADDVKFVINKDSIDGKTIYKIDNPVLVKDGEFKVGAVVDAVSLKPISSYKISRPPEQYKDKGYEITGEYKEKLYIKAKTAKSEQTINLNIASDYVDNESCLMLIRAFPLKEGFVKTFNLCIIQTAKVEPFEVKVIGRENVKVPYGEVDCYKVEIKYKGLGKGVSMYCWYSNDDSKTLVKYQNQNVVFELKSISNQK